MLVESYLPAVCAQSQLKWAESRIQRRRLTFENLALSPPRLANHLRRPAAGAVGDARVVFARGLRLTFRRGLRCSGQGVWCGVDF